ncbi:phenylacetate--CoA ligase family protein [Azospirillum sp. TSH100]|uniref:phenylacetate--CoA ligase family protein n=1 Tax=Azospirillum sp. TSH100 TaxID=652764 RepID=UPI0010AA128C|nr:phenylacetate--CoA ligase [Azospirillum sp. TSH100]QCG89691.1 phenylacetate--CoA ligase [Azospirillum sp. TSH100]
MAVQDHDAYWQPGLETQSRADWRQSQLDLLKDHLRHAYEGSPYYRAAFDAQGVSPGDLRTLDDLRRFPFLDKATIRDRQVAVPPFGDLVAVPEREIVYISASSGSTGVPTASPYTAKDFEEWIDYETRQFWSSGLRPADRYAHALNFSLFVGGPCVLGAQKLGALSIHAGTLPSERLLAVLNQFRATALWGAESGRGELVLTTLRKRARPIIRFRTGDIVSVTTQPCRCGRTSLRLKGVHGRLDDMLIVKGVNLFPGDVEAVVRQDPALTGEYRLVLERIERLDRLTVEAEHTQGFNGDLEELRGRLRRQLKAATGVGAEVALLAPGTLPRAVHKAKRIDDRRQHVWS